MELNLQEASVKTDSLLTRAFESLGLEIGANLQLETLRIKRKFQVSLLGYRANHSLMITAPYRHGKEVLLERGEPLALRFMSGKSVCAFESTVRYHCYQPYSYYHLSYPESVDSLNIRNAVRVSAELYAEVDSEFVILGDWPKTVQLKNLSETGLCFESSEFLGLLGHELVFTLQIPVTSVHSTLFLRGLIRNIEHPSPSNGLSDYQVGVQFVDLDERAKLVLTNYVLARKQGLRDA